MVFTSGLAALCGVCAAGGAGGGPGCGRPAQLAARAGEYQVVLKESAPEGALAALATRLSGRAHEIGAAGNSRFRSVFAQLTEGRAAEVALWPRVELVEPNFLSYARSAGSSSRVSLGSARRRTAANATAGQRAGASCPDLQQQPLSWGQSRITSTDAASAGGQYAHNASWGQGVDVYVLDTGVRTTHVEFAGGRAVWGQTFAGSDGADMIGHGTHVAGIVSGRVYGVAKSSTVVAVKIIGDIGEGTFEDAISGLEWVAQRARQTGRRSVVNMSIGGTLSAALNAAVAAVAAAEIPVVTSAGNCNYDACRNSPSSTPEAITVSATELVDDAGRQVDGRSPYANYGDCVDLFAPGTQIVAAGSSGDDAFIAQTGTSMAAPHVAAAAAAALSANPSWSAARVRQWLLDSAQNNISDTAGSPDRMLHIPC